MYPSSFGEILESSFNDTRESINTSPASTLEDGDSSGSQYGVDLTGKTTSIAGKSFTIAAILGLGGASKDVMNLSVQERFGVQERFSGFQNRFAGQKHLEEYLFARRDVQQRIYRESYGANTERNQDNSLSDNRLEQPTGHKSTKIGHQNSCHTNTNSNRNKRIRTIFTPEQLERLEAEFERQQYMVGPERLYLAHALHLTEAQVKVWFQNRRIKWRKHHLELTQQRLAVLQRHRHDDSQEDID